MGVGVLVGNGVGVGVGVGAMQTPPTQTPSGTAVHEVPVSGGFEQPPAPSHSLSVHSFVSSHVNLTKSASIGHVNPEGQLYSLHVLGTTQLVLLI